MIDRTQQRVPSELKRRNRKGLLAPVILIVGVVAFLSQTAGADTLESWQSCCGATCLRTVAGLLGSQTNLAEIRELLRPNNKGETSLAEIAETAKKMGFQAVGLRIKSERLPECSVPLIAHRLPQHFVVILGLGKGKGVLVIDPPSNPHQITPKGLREAQYWNVVAISRHALAIEEGGIASLQSQGAAQEETPHEYAGLRFDSTTWNFGSLKPGDTRTYEFPLENATEKRITLSGVKANCSCLKIVHFPESIGPGEHAVVRVLLKTEGMQGYIAKRVLGMIGDPGDRLKETFVLSVVGEVSRRGELLLRPAEIYLPDLVCGAKVARSVTLRRVGYEPLLLRGAQADSPAVSAMITPRSEGSSVEARVNLQIEALGKLGPFAYNVVFETDSPDNPTATLRIHGSVAPHISLEPSEAFLGFIARADYRETLIIVRSRTDTPFVIEDVKLTTDGLRARCERMNENRTLWRITLTPTESLRKGMVEGKVLLKIDDPNLPEFEIPYTGFVAS